MSGLNAIYEQAFKRQKKANDWGSLRRPPGGEEEKDADEPSNETKKGPLKRVYPEPNFSLTRVSGPTGRTSYEIRQKVQALEFSRLRCTDGAEVGKRGAASVLGINVRLLRSWEEQESELRKSLGAAAYHAGPSRSLHTGRSSPTEKVEDAIVDEVNTLSKQGVAVSSKIVMMKLLELMPNFQGGLPSADKPVEVEVFEKKFKRWYYRFLKRHRFSIRRKTSVGQKKPEGWEGKAWAFIQKLRARLLHHAKEAILVDRAAAAANAGDTVEIEVEGSPFTAEELSKVQDQVFGILYNMDQTPIQAEMPQETTVAPTGAKDARIATAGALVVVLTSTSVQRV